MALPVTPIRCALMLAGALVLGLTGASPIASLRSGRGRRSAGEQV
jgi:hypothetical protein